MTTDDLGVAYQRIECLKAEIVGMQEVLSAWAELMNENCNDILDNLFNAGAAARPLIDRVEAMVSRLEQFGHDDMAREWREVLSEWGTKC